MAFWLFLDYSDKRMLFRNMITYGRGCEERNFRRRKGVLKGMLLLLAVVSLYCYFQGELVWSGFFFLLIGVLSALSRSTYAVLFILIGLMPILFACEKIVLLVIVSLVMAIIALLNAVQLIRLMISRKWCINNKSESKEFLMCLKENEIIYKLWSKLKRKHIRP